MQDSDRDVETKALRETVVKQQAQIKVLLDTLVPLSNVLDIIDPKFLFRFLGSTVAEKLMQDLQYITKSLNLNKEGKNATKKDSEAGPIQDQGAKENEASSKPLPRESSTESESEKKETGA